VQGVLFLSFPDTTEFELSFCIEDPNPIFQCFGFNGYPAILMMTNDNRNIIGRIEQWKRILSKQGITFSSWR
jgi:hypothetical protein